MTTDQVVAGLSADEILDLCREYTLYEWGTQVQADPIPFAGAKGVYLWDADGKRYLDFNSQAMCVNIGHADERVVQAIAEQVAQLPYVVAAHATEARGKLGRELARISPDGLNKSDITLAGADANEAAIRIARLYTGRYKILTRYRSYHGSSQGVMMVNDRIAAHFEHHPLGHGITYGSHTVGCAALLATLSVYEEDNLIENAVRMGELIQSEYAAMTERHPSIGEARGRGLFIVLELTADRRSKAPLMSIDPDLTRRVDQFFRDEGMFANVRGTSSSPIRRCQSRKTSCAGRCRSLTVRLTSPMKLPAHSAAEAA